MIEWNTSITISNSEQMFISSSFESHVPCRKRLLIKLDKFLSIFIIPQISKLSVIQTLVLILLRLINVFIDLWNVSPRFLSSNCLWKIEWTKMWWYFKFFIKPCWQIIAGLNIYGTDNDIGNDIFSCLTFC